jgi:TusA-related sulfurtransferase
MYTRKEKEKYQDLDINTLITIILDKEKTIKNVIEFIKENSDVEGWIDIPNFELTDKLEEGLK